MTVKFSPWGNQQFFDENGDPAVGWKIYTYLAGSSTPATTYTTSVGNVAQTNPVILNSLGFVTTGQLWLTEGVSYKLVLTNAADVVKKTEDNISGVNEASSAGTSEWVVSALVPTFVSTVSFTVTGDQTSIFNVGRRLKTVNTGGTVYSTITASVFTTLTTITVVNDAGVLDSGISVVSYALLSGTNPSVPPFRSTSILFETSGNVPLKRNINTICNGRLTLTTLVPVTTVDVLAATAVKFTPYLGNAIALYDGSSIWDIFTFAELSVAVPGTTSTMYDVFAFNNSGVAALEALAWANDTTRATALVLQDGVYVKSGAVTRRYLGSFRTTTVSGQTEDSIAKRYLWNYYNRMNRKMFVADATATWNYTTAAFRQANAAATNQLDMVIGVSEQPVMANVSAAVSNATANVQAEVGIGVDSTTVNSADTFPFLASQVVNTPTPVMAQYAGFPGIGRHFLAWLEYSAATGTSNWKGTASPLGTSGISGWLWA